MQAANVNSTTLMNSDNKADVSSQYLTFFMDNEEYGVDILAVQEIRGWESVTPLPNAPPHIKGVINLRGTIVPIIELRQCFNLKSIEYTPLTVVIVLKVTIDNKSRVIGIVVDAVSDVYSLSRNELKAVPDLGEKQDVRFVTGLVSVNDKMVILLNLDHLLLLDTMTDIKDLREQMASDG